MVGGNSMGLDFRLSLPRDTIHGSSPREVSHSGCASDITHAGAVGPIHGASTGALTRRCPLGSHTDSRPPGGRMPTNLPSRPLA